MLGLGLGMLGLVGSTGNSEHSGEETGSATMTSVRPPRQHFSKLQEATESCHKVLVDYQNAEFSH